MLILEVGVGAVLSLPVLDTRIWTRVSSRAVLYSKFHWWMWTIFSHEFGKSGIESFFSNVVLLPQTEVWSLTALPYNHVDDPSSPNISLLSLLILPLYFFLKPWESLHPESSCISQPHFLELPTFSQTSVFKSPLVSKLYSLQHLFVVFPLSASGYGEEVAREMKDIQSKGDSHFTVRFAFLQICLGKQTKKSGASCTSRITNLQLVDKYDLEI